ncbi:hypothetical protein D3C81_2002870 [compost metagenome]
MALRQLVEECRQFGIERIDCCDMFERILYLVTGGTLQKTGRISQRELTKGRAFVIAFEVEVGLITEWFGCRGIL